MDKKDIDYIDECITQMRNITDLSRLNHTQADGYIFIMCRQGLVKLHLNGQPHDIAEHTFIVCMPGQHIDHLMVSPDTKVNVVRLSVRLVQELMRNSIKQWNRMLYINKRQVNNLSEQHLQQLAYYDYLLESKLQTPNEPYHKEIIRTIIHALLYEILSMMEQSEWQTDMAEDASTGHMHFKRFLDTLTNATVKKQTVEYYARQLCITPKYLATICKACSQKSAHEWIADMVNEDIRYLLLSTDLSVKEVALRLGFENTSFFGKYFKKHFGCTPMEYRISHTQSSQTPDIP